MSSSLILSATRGHLHSVLPDVAVRMSSLAISVNLQPSEKSSVLPVQSRRRTSFDDLQIQPPVASQQNFAFQVDSSTDFVVRLIKVRKPLQDLVLFCILRRAHATKGFRETDKSLGESSRSGSAADKARRTRHRLAWPSFHFLSNCTSSLARHVVFLRR